MLRKKRKEPEVKPEPKRDLYKEAMEIKEKLERLEMSKKVEERLDFLRPFSDHYTVTGKSGNYNFHIDFENYRVLDAWNEFRFNRHALFRCPYLFGINERLDEFEETLKKEVDDIIEAIYREAEEEAEKYRKAWGRK